LESESEQRDGKAGETCGTGSSVYHIFKPSCPRVGPGDFRFGSTNNEEQDATAHRRSNNCVGAIGGARERNHSRE